jgi:hypothetical protein
MAKNKKRTSVKKKFLKNILTEVIAGAVIYIIIAKSLVGL